MAHPIPAPQLNVQLTRHQMRLLEDAMRAVERENRWVGEVRRAEHTAIRAAFAEAEM